MISPNPPGAGSGYEHFAAPRGPRFREFACGTLRPAESPIFSQGDEVDAVFLIEDGLVKLDLIHPDGRESIVGLRARGWIIGAASAIASECHVVSAIAAAPTRVAMLGAEEFNRLLKTDESFTRHVLLLNAHEVCMSLTSLGDGSIPASARLRQFLADLAAPREPGAGREELRVMLPLRQWEIAQLLNIAPPYLCQLMSRLESSGVLRRERNGVIILRVDSD